MKGTAYLIQGTLVSLWWLGLAVSPDFYSAFQFPGISSIAFNSFFAPDLLVIMLLSVIRAYRPSRALELIILGGFAYGSLYCLNASVLSGGGFLPTTIMLLGLCYNLFLIYQNSIFRESVSSSRTTNALKTFCQILCIWSITLVLFPWFIIDAFEITASSSPIIRYLAYGLFILSSILGLTSAYVIVKHGDGTPLPADQTKSLVVSGPYKFVRNPMAIAGMGQGLAIGIYFTSIHIAIYTLMGGIIWHLAVRPLEEKNMIKRFGEAYLDYRRSVGLWLPRLQSR